MQRTNESINDFFLHVSTHLLEIAYNLYYSHYYFNEFLLSSRMQLVIVHVSSLANQFAEIYDLCGIVVLTVID